jgi:hypothetical protein
MTGCKSHLALTRARWAGVSILLGSLAVSLVAAAPAAAQMSSAECTTQNLLADRMPAGQQDAHGDARHVTDGKAAPEGAQWDTAAVVMFLDTPAGSITYDLGVVRSISAFLLQADANDTYKVFGATENTPSSFKLLTEIDSVVNVGHGLRTRPVRIEPTAVRYIKIGEPLGDNSYSISEFQAYCQPPTPFPPKLPTVDAPPATVVSAPWYEFKWFANDESARFEMVLAFLAMALLIWGIRLDRTGRSNYRRGLRDVLLALVGITSFVCYFNFGLWHFPNRVHQWDTFHYYVGSKYFNELSYDRLYECVAVADSEAPGLRRRVELRKVMNLRTNMMEGTQRILAHPEDCKKHFTPERWEAFKHDVAHFRSKHDVKRWEEAQTDHGYNGTPVWNILGTTLANTGPASDGQIDWITWIDPLFIVGMTLLSMAAFGWRTTCVALAVFATNFPSRFYWTGGAFLRWDWLFYFVSGICLLKLEHPLLGGFFLGYSTLLRIFPMFVFAGPLVVAFKQLWGTHGPDDPYWLVRLPDIGSRLKTNRAGREVAVPELIWNQIRIYKPQPFTTLRAFIDRLERRYLMLFLGAALAVGTLMPLSLVTSSGVDGYRAFIFNTSKHKETPLTNHMGLRTVVTYSTSEAGRSLQDSRDEDPWGKWKRAKVATFHRRRPLYALFCLGFAAMLFAALRTNSEPWFACAMGSMMIAVGIELTCYYYSFLFATTFLYSKRKEAGAIMLGITGATGFIDWAPTKYLPSTGPLAGFRISQWLDEQYMLMSVVTLVGFVWIMYKFAAGPEVSEETVAAASVPRGSAGKGGSGAGGGGRGNRGGRNNKRKRR